MGGGRSDFGVEVGTSGGEPSVDGGSLRGDGRQTGRDFGGSFGEGGDGGGERGLGLCPIWSSGGGRRVSGERSEGSLGGFESEFDFVEDCK